jgi:hypothetical protein
MHGHGFMMFAVVQVNVRPGLGRRPDIVVWRQTRMGSVSGMIEELQDWEQVRPALAAGTTPSNRSTPPP